MIENGEISKNRLADIGLVQFKIVIFDVKMLIYWVILVVFCTYKTGELTVSRKRVVFVAGPNPVISAAICCN